jgi:NADH-quinone oxidoreductase subunit M
VSVLAAGLPPSVAAGHHLPWLTVVTFVPLAGAAVLGFLPTSLVNLHRWWALFVTLVTFGFALAMFGQFKAGVAGFQLVERATWVRSLNLHYFLGVDGISLFLVMLTTFLMPAGVLVSWRIEEHVKSFMLAFLILETAMIGSFLALDLLLFFFFFEALLFPMYLIIGGWGSERRIYAAVKFFLYTMAGSAFLLLGILFLYFQSGSQFGTSTFDYTQLQHLSLPVASARWLFLAFFVAFAVKTPLFPLHTWLPDAHTEAPTAGSLDLAAVVIKVGAYGLIRFNLGLFPEASSFFRTLVMVLAVIGIIYGAVVALIQVDLKRLVAYSSVSHMGFVVLGIFAFTLQGMSGGVITMVNHGLSTGALFLLVGMLYDRTHTRDLIRLNGLAPVLPIFAGVFLFVALSSIGLPGLNGFVGEFLVILGTFISSKGFAVAAVPGVVLSAIYLLWGYQRLMHGPPVIAGGAVDGAGTPNGHPPAARRAAAGARAHPWAHLRDLELREYFIIVPIMAAILFIGIYPKPILSRIERSTSRAVACVQRSRRGASFSHVPVYAAPAQAPCPVVRGTP